MEQTKTVLISYQRLNLSSSPDFNKLRRWHNAFIKIACDMQKVWSMFWTPALLGKFPHLGIIRQSYICLNALQVSLGWRKRTTVMTQNFRKKPHPYFSQLFLHEFQRALPPEPGQTLPSAFNVALHYRVVRGDGQQRHQQEAQHADTEDDVVQHWVADEGPDSVHQQSTWVAEQLHQCVEWTSDWGLKQQNNLFKGEKRVKKVYQKSGPQINT